MLNTPMQVDTGLVKIGNIGAVSAAPMGMGAGLMGAELMGAGLTGGALQNSSSTMGGGFYQPDDRRMDMAYMNGGEMFGQEHGGAFYSEFESREGGVYDGIALPEHYLGEYYSQVRR